jgi:hypothetical protein
MHSFIHSSMALQPFVGPWRLLQFRNLFYTDDRTPWTSDQPIARPLPTRRTTDTPTSMPWLGFEPTIPESELRKTMPHTARPLWSTLEVYRNYVQFLWCLSLYGSTALVNHGRFFSFLIYIQSERLLGWGISLSQGRYLHTEQHKRSIMWHRHPCLEWDSNPRAQCSCRRWFVP